MDGGAEDEKEMGATVNCMLYMEARWKLSDYYHCLVV